MKWSWFIGVSGALLVACSDNGKSKCDGNDVAGVCIETANVHGTISDKDGKPAENVEVALIGSLPDRVLPKQARTMADSVIDKATTGSDGKFLFKKVISGDYTVRAIKDTLGVVKSFTHSGSQDTDLANLTLVNNGIIIGSVERGIVQQAENAYAIINEIGQQTSITQAGDFTFNNVPVYNNYTISIFNGDGKPLDSKIEDIVVSVQSGKAVVVDSAGTKTTEKPILAVSVPITQSVAEVVKDLPNGTLTAILTATGQDTIRIDAEIEEGKTPSLPIAAIAGSTTWKVHLEAKDSAGIVQFEGTSTIDLGKDKLEDLEIELSRKTGRLLVRESLGDKLYTDAARTRRIAVLLKGGDTLTFQATRTASTVLGIDSIPVGLGAIVQGEYLDADGKAQYRGLDTIDILGNGKDTAFIELSRLKGSLAISGSFVDEDGNDLADLDFDTAYAWVFGVSTDTVRIQLEPESNGEFSVKAEGVAAGDKRYVLITAASNGGSRKFSLKDSLAIEVGKEAEWSKNVRSAPTIPVFNVKDYEIEVEDTLEVALSWEPKTPDSAVVSLTSLNTNFVRVSGSKFWGYGVGSGRVVAAVQGLAQRDTFTVKVDSAKRSFTMKLDTNAFEVTQGADARTKGRLNRTKLAASITFSASGAPDGTTIGFAPATLTTSSDTTVMTITVTGNTFPGDYKFAVIARTAGYADRVDSVTLKVNRDNSMEWVKISTGYSHTCAINKDGDAYCWGQNANGQLGIGTTVAQTRPMLVSGGIKWKSINSQNAVSCGISTDDVGYCWGWGAVGMLGNGGTENRLIPTEISVTGGDRWSNLSVGSHNVCGVTTDGRGFCWGARLSGGLGDSTVGSNVDGNPASSLTSTRVEVKEGIIWKKVETGGFSGVTSAASTNSALEANSLTSAYSSTCGVSNTNEVYCWGNNRFGQLANSDPGATGYRIPIKIPGSKNWVDIEFGSGHVCALTNERDAYCWGFNTHGQVGNGNTTNQSSPTLVLGDLKWDRLFGGAFANCGITVDSTAYCWGSNDEGEIGTGAATANQTAPAKVFGNMKWIDLGSGSDRSCGINQYNQAFCWGNGNLGAGNTTTSLKPTRVLEPLGN